jgi:L-rhamnose isomerase
MKEAMIEKAYDIAEKRYAEYGVNVSEVLKKLDGQSLSIHCWQGDDVRGFEISGSEPGGGLAVTGNYPGRARNADELQTDLKTALSLIPGRHRLNLHAIYGDFSGFNKDRDSLSYSQYSNWVGWAKELGLALDFNASCFGHVKASDGWTLCSLEEDKRLFWVEHVKRCREIGEYFGRTLGKPCMHNLWIPDGCKDNTMLRFKRREKLKQSLSEIYSVCHGRTCLMDSVESKLFGIGSEAFVAGSYEFYTQWVSDHNFKNMDNVLLCLDMGHFHPTESVADKISSILMFQQGLLLHISRGLRWDSDHVAILDDSLKEVMLEIVRADALERTYLALDYFDASINRIGAWVTGARSTLMAILFALLEPREKIREYELEGDGLSKLALLETCKTMPFGAIWDYWCVVNNVPDGINWLDNIGAYEKEVLSKR